ncbi:hypothetical protein ATL39_0905 [Sinobaca qinghaiensis]|uniref:Uncharacterized protein n=1 Tax=Sinobaca qinghaiensis TaxID=342944 RepID=A0A419V5N5_9BACL|nr:XtrA/YqaO family protein [Sinobaca qinghaiensis]RKD75207.1 hypothetical protein ATL39_0905 [Sinobaca qinghaiensis]
MENIDIDMQTRSLDIDILKRNKPLATICSGDKAKLEELPDHGEVKIITYQCKVKRVKQDEGGGFLNNIINFFNEVSPGGWMSFFGTIAAAFVGVITYKLSEKQAEHRDRIKQRDEYRKVLLDNERKIDNILNSYKSY